MKPALLRYSLKTRITLFTLAIFVLSLWALAYFATRVVQQDMVQLLNDQQASTAHLVAEKINEELQNRFDALESLSRRLDERVMSQPKALQADLEDRLVINQLFNGGFYVTDSEGTAIASLPVDANRIGINWMFRNHVATALKEGKAAISTVDIGKALNVPVFGLAVPKRNAQGQIIGSVVGVINLTTENFLDKIMLPYAKTGGFVIVSRQQRLIVTATDKRRVMESAPAPGVSPAIDRFLDGHEGTVAFVNPRGVEVFQSVKGIPLANWYVGVQLPVAEALAPIRDMQQRMLLATMLLTLLAGGLAWWMLGRQLAPMHVAATALRERSAAGQSPSALPNTAQDEIGQLIGGFNQLLETLKQREDLLHQSEARLTSLLDETKVHLWAFDGERYTFMNKQWFDFTGQNPVGGLTIEVWTEAVHPDDLPGATEIWLANWATKTEHDNYFRLRRHDGVYRDFYCHAVPVMDSEGVFQVFHGFNLDITDRKLADAALKLERDSTRNILATVEAMIVALDPDGRITLVNRKACEILGYREDELIGQDWFATCLPRSIDVEQVRKIFKYALAGNLAGSEYYENPVRTRSGEERLIAWHNSSIRDKDGNIIGGLSAGEDITSRKQAEEELRESEARYRVITTHSPAGIFQTNAQGDCIFANPRWCEIAGLTSDEAMGQGWSQAVHPDDKQRVFDGWYAAAKSGSSCDWECRFVAKQGKQSWITGHAEPLLDQHGNSQGYLGVIVDITERKHAEDATRQQRDSLEELVTKRTLELALAKQAAETANIAKSAFLANMSHEIRTPLNAITGMAHILRRSGLTSDQTDKLDKIENAGTHLLNIINDVLDLSKIEAGKFVLEDVPVHVETLLGNIAAMLGQKARDKGLRFHIETNSLPHNLHGDPTRLQQALLNYAANALKFTETGHITLRAKEVAQTDTAATLRFEVEDTGIGIAPDALPKLFGAFEQADNSTTRKYGGTGLGLAITKKIAAVMGGAAGVTSSEGQGSTFWFTAVLRKAEQSVEELAKPGDEEAEQVIQRDHAGKRILLAEDEPINREVGLMLLEDVGLEVDLAEDGRQAVEKAGSGRYDVILMDMQMPVLDGLDATRQIRKIPGCESIPILAMTANAFAENKDQCFEAGMNDFISKPVDPEILFEILLKWLRRK